MTYTITTVDWNPGQTKVWLAQIKKHCRDYELVILPEKRRYPSCWSSPKLYCFDVECDTEYFVYMDTDAYVLGDLSPIFKSMKDKNLAISVCLGGWGRFIRLQHGKYGLINDAFGLKEPAIHMTAGLIVLKGIEPRYFYKKWCDAFDLIEETWPELPEKGGTQVHGWSCEIPFSFMIARMIQDGEIGLYHIPKKYHDWVKVEKQMRRMKRRPPLVIHYRHPENIKNWIPNT